MQELFVDLPIVYLDGPDTSRFDAPRLWRRVLCASPVSDEAVTILLHVSMVFSS